MKIARTVASFVCLIPEHPQLAYTQARYLLDPHLGAISFFFGWPKGVFFLARDYGSWEWSVGMSEAINRAKPAAVSRR